MSEKPYCLTLLLNSDLALTPEWAARHAFLLVRRMESDSYNELHLVGDVQVIRVNTHVFHRLVSQAVMDRDWVALVAAEGADAPAIASIGPSTERGEALDAVIAQAAKDYPVSSVVRSFAAP